MKSLWPVTLFFTAIISLQLNAADRSEVNALTPAEKAAGWKLLFDGKTLNGWHTFKREGVRPGWQVKEATLACVDPHDAGDRNKSALERIVGVNFEVVFLIGAKAARNSHRTNAFV